MGVVEHPKVAISRIPPDPLQFQVILGSLLGDGQLVGLPRERRLRIAHRVERREYVMWKYDRLGPFPVLLQLPVVACWLLVRPISVAAFAICCALAPARPRAPSA